MRPTGDERRKVAAKLRWDANNIEWVFGDKLNGLMFDVFGDGGHEAGELFARLADLIDPVIADDTSDGCHTFAQLYHQRMVLWAAIVKANAPHAWKTRRHEDGEPCFGGGWFLVTVDTPEGAYGYHCEDTPENWSLFACRELPKAKPWDGYDGKDVGRVMSLVDGSWSGERVAE